MAYKYAALDAKKEEIRLLHLHPGAHGDPVVISIFHTPLVPSEPRPKPDRLTSEQLQRTVSDDWWVKEVLDGRYLFVYVAEGDTPNSWNHPDPNFDKVLYELPPSYDNDDFEPRYDALSYTWGSQEDPHSLTVTTGSETMAPTVSANLAQALRYLRHTEEPRTLWIDAICINQEDQEERNAQVKRMGNIYSLARRVVVWLGEESHDSKHALHTLEHLGRQIELCADNYYGDAPGAEYPDWHWLGRNLPYDERDWQALISLFRRDWFSRVWVLQEVQLANLHAIVQCGNDKILWHAIRKSIVTLAEKRGVPPELTELISSHRIGLNTRPTMTLTNILLWAQTRKCSENSDRVYGVLSLAPPSIASRIEPKYELPLLQVYIDAFTANTEATKRLDMIRHCRLDQRIEGRPSWIPNWETVPAGLLSSPRVGISRQPAGLSAAHVRHIDSQTSEILGRQCAQVRAVGAISAANGREVFHAVLKWHKDNLQFVGADEDFGRLDAFLEVVFQGRLRERYPKMVGYPTTEEVRQAYLSSVREATATDTMLKLLSPIKVDGSSLFLTSEGLIGLAFAGAQEDDRVCVLLGCDRLMLLRPTERGSFLVVGPCFVHGLMDAESLLGPLSSPWKVQLRPFNGCYEPEFLNREHGNVEEADPRLPPLSSEWTSKRRRRTQDDPYYYRDFENVITGEKMNSDPRMLPKALEERGIELDWLQIV